MPEAQDTAGALFAARQLGQAIAAANAEVRRSPSNLGGRVLLAELLLFAGNLDRADTILDAAATADPSSAVVVAEFRQLLRAEIARRQCSREGRIPEFLGEPTAALRAALAALVALRAGDIDEATRHAAEAAAVRPKVSGVLRQDGDATIRVLVGQGSPIELGTPGLILDVQLPKGGAVSIPVPARFNGFVHMLDGEASFGANHSRAKRGQIAVLGPGGVLAVENAQPGTRFVLMAGKPYGEWPVYNGPYVD